MSRIQHIIFTEASLEHALSAVRALHDMSPELIAADVFRQMSELAAYRLTPATIWCGPGGLYQSKLDAIANGEQQIAPAIIIGTPDELIDDAHFERHRALAESERLQGLLNERSAQLAERDALLCPIAGWTAETRTAVQEAFQDELNESANYPWYDAAIADLMRLIEAIPSRAEPSAPKYHRQPLGMDEAVRERLTLIAREAAISSAHRYNYMPAIAEDALQWQPHAWVLEAMRMAELAASAEPSAPVDCLDCSTPIIQGPDEPDTGTEQGEPS